MAKSNTWEMPTTAAPDRLLTPTTASWLFGVLLFSAAAADQPVPLDATPIPQSNATSSAPAESAWGEVDRIARHWQLTALPDLALAKDDIEIRLWTQGWKSLWEGYVLQRRGGHWRAYAIAGPEHQAAHAMKGYLAAELTPVCRIDSIVEALVVEGLFELTHAIPFHPGLEVHDGSGTIVETVRNGSRHRGYYENPGLLVGRPDASVDYSRVHRIQKIIHQELFPRARLGYQAHPQSVQLGQIILARSPQGSGFGVRVVDFEYPTAEYEGRLVLETQSFLCGLEKQGECWTGSATPSRFAYRWSEGTPTPEQRNSPIQLFFQNDSIRVGLRSEPTHVGTKYKIAVTPLFSFDEIDLNDPRLDWRADRRGPDPVCLRYRQLTPPSESE